MSTTTAYEELLEFVYVSPFALARIDEAGTIDMMNSMGANLLLEFAPSPEISNLLDILDSVDTGVRELVTTFSEERGPICEGRRIAIDRFEGGDPLVLSLNLLKLGPGRIMVAFGDVSKLEAAHRAQRFILDSVSDGLVTVDALGRMSDQCSAMLVRWLGAPVADEPIWTYIGRKHPSFASALEFAWESLTDDILPLELCIEQLPRRLSVDGVALSVSYEPLMSGDKWTHLMVVMRDIGAQLERERLDAEQRELMAAMSHLSTDRDGFRGFLDEAAKLVLLLTEVNPNVQVHVERALHTLKGNAGMFGISSVATMCHELEDRLRDGGRDALEESERMRLGARWAVITERFRSLIVDNDNALMVSRKDHGDLLELARSAASRDEIVTRVESLALAPVQLPLQRLADQAVALGERLGKATIAAHVDGIGLRHDLERFTPFWAACVHAVRNAVDHGVETTDERLTAGKPAIATLDIRVEMDGDEVIVVLEDDGRGVDWEKIAARASAAGLSCVTHAEHVEALFRDGISSRDAVSETSGRGAGMGALRAACEQFGGKVDVESCIGAWTRVTFRFPASNFWIPARRTATTAPRTSPSMRIAS